MPSQPAGSTPWIRGRALPARCPTIESSSKGNRIMTLQEQWERQKQAQQQERQRRAGEDHRAPMAPEADRQPDAEDPLEEEGTFSDEGTRG
jgi:hypothetical protein